LSFETQFADRAVTLLVTPARIAGSGKATVGGKRVCILGDEAKVSLNATYTTPVYSVAGQGLVTISKLANDQVAKDSINATPLITRGSKFVALFTPTTPATQPPPSSAPDAAPPSLGSGEFRVQQTACTAGSA